MKPLKDFVHSRIATIYFIFLLLLTFGMFALEKHVEEIVLRDEKKMHLIAGKEFVDYVRSSVRITFDAMKSVSGGHNEILENKSILKSIKMSRFASARLFNNDVWVVDNKLNFVFDNSKDTDYDWTAGKINLLEDTYDDNGNLINKASVNDSHYGGRGLDIIGEKIKKGQDSDLENCYYYYWKDENGIPRKEYAVWSIIPNEGTYFDGTEKFWAVVLTIKEEIIMDAIVKYENFLHLFMAMFISILWIGGSLMVYYKIRLDVLEESHSE